MMPKIPTVCKNICEGLLPEQRKTSKFQTKDEFQFLVEKESDKLKRNRFGILLEYLDDYGEVSMAHVRYCVERQSELTGVAMIITDLKSMNCVLAKMRTCLAGCYIL